MCTPMQSAGIVDTTGGVRRWHPLDIDTSDLSGHLPEAENILPDHIIVSAISRETLRKNHHGKECIICFEKECQCKPRI